MNLIDRIRTDRIWLPFIYTIVMLGLSWVIYQQVAKFSHWSEFVEQFRASLSLRGGLILITVCILVWVNWSLEALKWQLLNNKISRLQALKVILVGVTMGLITPFHLGDYLGRIYAAGTARWKKSTYFTFLCSISQNLLNLSIGLAMIMVFLPPYTLILPYYWWYVLGFIIVVSIMLYFIFEKLPIKVISTFIEKPTVANKIKVKLILVSFFRYSVYASQYVLLMLLFGSEMDISGLFIGVSSIFLVQSGLPLPPAVSAIARVEIAILIFSYEGESELIVLFSALLLWSVNVFLPALLGYFSFLRIKTGNHEV